MIAAAHAAPSIFHKTVWRMIGTGIQHLHDGSSSHSAMIAKAGWRENEPNRKTLNFEADWDMMATAMLPPNRLIRGHHECPERLERRIVEHYNRVFEAVVEGRHLDGYFKNSKQWGDVWEAAANRGVSIAIPSTMENALRIYGHVRLLDLENLTGSLYVLPGATFEAPNLSDIGITLHVYGVAELKAVRKIGGHLHVGMGGRVNLPSLVEVMAGVNVGGRARLDSLEKVGGTVNGKIGETYAPKLLINGVRRFSMPMA